MYKKIFSAILFGALTIASTSTFVSCKDYDDDIDALNTRVDANDADNQALHTALDAANAELKNLKQQLADEVSRLDGLVAAAQGTADQAKVIADRADALSQENQKAIANEIIRATAAEAALEVRIKKLEDEVIPDLEKLIKDLQDNKLDKKDFEEETAKIWAKMEAIETDLGKALRRIETLEKGLEDEIKAREALAEDLAQQKEIIKNHGERLDNLENKVVPELRKLISDLRSEYEAKVKEIEGKIDALDKRVKANEDDIATLKEDVRKINEELEKVNNKLNELNVLILRSLRSLVFIPDFYYWGIEATDFDVVNYAYFFELPKVDADTPDPTFNKKSTLHYGQSQVTVGVPSDEDVWCYDHSGHKTRIVKDSKGRDSVACQGHDFNVENFVAHYHLNPSSANLAEAKINILSGDRKYRTRAGSEMDNRNDNIIVQNWNPAKDVENGDLNLNLAVNNYELLKKVGHIEDEGTQDGGRHFVQDKDETMQVTVFAAEVTLDDEMKNTVTSDYAALLVNVKNDGYRLLHTTDGDKGSYTGVKNWTDGADPSHKLNITCHRDNFVDNRVLFTDGDETIFRAGVNAAGNPAQLVNQPLVSAKDDAPSTTFAQDVVRYDQTLNLFNLVSVASSRDGEKQGNKLKEWLDAQGFELKFELTGIFMNQNVTSESAHAAIDKDGVTFRPQLPDFSEGDAGAGQLRGKAAAFGATKQDPTTIGRTPMVRVSLIDKNHENRILDYGYIRIVIVDKPQEDKPILDTWNIVEYNTGMSFDYSYNVCVGEKIKNTWPWRQTWASFEKDLYNMYNRSQEEFEQRYDSVVIGNQNATRYAHFAENALQQYSVKINGTDTTFTKLTPAEHLGMISIQPGIDVGTGTRTQIITWNVTTQELKNYADDKKTETTRAILYDVVKPDGIVQKIYVILKAGDVKKSDIDEDKPTLSAKWDKIIEYWYDQNSQTAKNTLKEAHLNVPSPEDGISTWLESRECPFEFILSSDFNGNNLFPNNDWKKFITITPSSSAYKVENADKTGLEFMVFSAAKKVNEGGTEVTYDANNKATGYSGTVYTIFTKDRVIDGVTYKNWELWARTTNTKVQFRGSEERIAYLDKGDYYDQLPENEKINDVKIVLDKTMHRDNHTNSFIEDILNYVAHDKLNDNAIKIYVGVGLTWYGLDQKTVCFEAQVPFQLRLLRPVNMFPEEPVQVQDAANTTQIIYLYDLVKFTDWREQWNPTAASTQNKERREYRITPDGPKWIVDYWYYYNIKHILIGDAASTIDPDQPTWLNDRMHTNINGNDITKTILSDVSNNVEFRYLPSANPDAVIGDREYYGMIKYTNNRSTVDEFDVTVPITVCYEWGHLTIPDVKIKVVKTLENTDVKVVR